MEHAEASRVHLGSPAARAAAECLRASTALLCLGTALHSLRYEGPVFTWLFMARGWSEEAALRMEHGAAWLLLAAAPLVLLRRGWPALLLVSLWMAARAAAQAADEVWHPELIPFDLGARILAPLSLVLLTALPTDGTIPHGRFRASLGLLRVAVAATFAGHGVEALLRKPEFIDLILASGRRLGGLAIPEAAAREALGAIGTLDLLVAGALLVPLRFRCVAAWAAFWGLLTASSRVVQMGWWNAPEALVRVIHAGAPLALLVAWQFSRPPIRRCDMAPRISRRPALARVAVLTLLLAMPALAQESKSKTGPKLPAGTTPAHARVIWSERPEAQATISWSTAQSGSTHRVHYDLQPRKGSLAAYAWRADAQKNGRFTGSPELYYHHATVTGLQASTTYYFVMASDSSVSPEHHFVTAPSDERPFRLLLGGDSRSDAAARRKMNGILAGALEKDPGILALCHGGDYMRTGTNLAEWAEWMEDHRLTVTSAGRMLPVIPVRGNHEKSGVQFDEVWNWPGGGLGKNYYATKVGPQSLIVTLNTNISTEGDQARFLEQTLKNHATVRWQLAQYHRPVYPAVKSPSAGKDAWVPIFERYNLDLVCESDGHNIKRTVPIRNDRHDPTGVVYVGEGGLGVSQRTPDDDLWYLQPPGKCGKGHHYFLLSFEKETLRTRIVLMDGTVFDEYELKARKR
jgi:hypothetical protein